MQERQARRRHDSCPQRHVRHRVLVEEGQSLPVDVEDCEVEEDPPLGDLVELRETDARAEPCLSEFVNDVLFKFEGGEQSVDEDAFVDSVGVIAVEVEIGTVGDGVADDA